MTELDQSFTHRITLLRHGESAGNAQGVYQGRAEYDLKEKGQTQARTLGAYWQTQGTTFTQIISEALATPLEFDERWQEIDNGILAGVPLDVASEKNLFPDFMTPFDRIGESGESNWDLNLRAGTVVQELLTRPPGNYLVVSHGGFLNRVLYVILGIVPQVNFSGARFVFNSTSFAVLQYDPSRHIWIFEQLNEPQHWLSE